MSGVITYRMRIAWSGRNSGYMTVSSATGSPFSPNSKIAPATNSAGYDVIGDSLNAPIYAGPYDTLPIDKYGPIDFTLTRGRDDQFSNMLAGKLDLTVKDVYPGRYNPKNSASPLFGKIAPMRPGTLDASLDGGNTYIPLFTGWMVESASNPDWSQGNAVFTFLDLFVWLDRAQNVSIASTGPTTVGAAINLCLNAIGWSQTYRRIATGGPIPDFFVDPGDNLLQVLAELIQVDMGDFFHSRDGYATYLDRYEIARRTTSTATYTSSGLVVPGTSLDTVLNAASATLEGSVQQTYQDDISGSQYGYGSWPDITSRYFNSDADAYGYCRTEVILGKDPVGKVLQHELDELGDDPASLLQTEFLDRVTVSAFGSNTDYHVQKMVHQGAGGKAHTTTLVLSERPAQMPFMVGSSAIAPLASSQGYDAIWR